MRQAYIADSADEAQNEINLTPMLDVVFIMLIFFLVVASFLKEVGLDVNRPDRSTNPDSQEESIVVTIQADNGIWIDGRLIDPRAVRANIERQYAEKDATSVVIRAHKHSANNTFVQVMDSARQAGLYEIALAAWTIDPAPN